MVLLRKSSDPDCHYRVDLVLVCLLHIFLLPSQLLAVTCEQCGFNYDQEDFKFCPTASCNREAESQPPQHDTAPPQGATGVNPDSDPGAQVNGSQRNLDYAINVLGHVAANIRGDFVISPDGLFQTVAMLLLHVGADGAAEQLRQIYVGEYSSEPTGAASSRATESGQEKNRNMTDWLAASQPDPLAIYRERLEEANRHARSNVNFTNRGPIKNLALLLNSLFCQLTSGIIQRFCNSNVWPRSWSTELISAYYFIGLRERSFGTQNAAGLFTSLPNDQAATLRRIVDEEIRPSQYAHHNDWEAFSFPYPNWGNEEMVLIIPPAGIVLYGLSSEIIKALLSSLDSEKSISTTTHGLPPSRVDTSTHLSEALSRSGSGLLSVVTSDLSSGAIPTMPARMNVYSDQAAPDATLTHTDFERTHEGDTIRPIQFDRPFIYILRNRMTKIIIYIGRIFYLRDTS
ncbi:serpin family protein [Endozoicomonas sp. 2B-B]